MGLVAWFNGSLTFVWCGFVAPRTGLLCAVLVILSILCTTHPVAAASFAEEGVHKLYEDGLRLFHEGRYKKAIAVFDKIEALYPFSQMAIDGSLVAAVAHYELGNYAESASLAEGYIDSYPSSKSIDYAYYVRILAKYMQIPDLGLDQGVALEVRNLAYEFVRMFPNSRHLGEISKRLAAVQQHLAAREFMIGKFYLKRGGYIAAVKRFRALISAYPSSAYTNEGLYRLVEAYTALGDHKSAAAYLSKLDEGNVWRARAERLLSGEKNCAQEVGQEGTKEGDDEGKSATPPSSAAAGEEAVEDAQRESLL
ncbi:DNA uptake lipoprotein ComL [Anaplasma marginale str. Gypsy Plains]|uniref:outer membrane protein assembly factor BamD n=1 Tax=Anaplasma marginale TaxID=770 RepID=UPI0003C337B9|nr:outer membrane protein assembly factor BamD [Anaplasma marginale]AGZ79087.1 DNA uptake lipoprotein ComL [Anaplasma marginale str. Gypsy Plains]